MKRLLILSALAVVVPLSASADQFSILYGLMNSPSGGYKFYTNKGKYAFKSTKAPTGLYYSSDNLRVGYLEYKLLAADGGAVSSNVIVDVQALSFEYQQVFPEGYFYHVGLANFSSQFHYNYYTVGYSDDLAINNEGYTDKLLDPGLIGGGGMQFQFGLSFLSAEIIYIMSKTMDYKYMDYDSSSWQTSTSDDYSSDVGTMIIGVSAGTNF